MQSTSSSFSVMTYNIHRGQGVLRKRDVLEDLVKSVENCNMDIICFQEIMSDDEDALPAIAETFQEENFWIHKNITYFIEEGHQGNAILSRFPIKQFRYIDLTVEKYEERGLLLADIELPTESGESMLLHVGCLHLGLIESERLVQLQKLEGVLEEAISDEHPFILAGDFNDWRRKIWMKPFLKSHMKEAFLESTGHYARTFPSFLPLLPLDRIYYSRCDLIKAHHLKGKPWSKLSDHLPLKADFRCQRPIALEQDSR